MRLNGGAERDRTVGLLNAIQALSQLSYSPTNMQNNIVKNTLSNPIFVDMASSFLYIECCAGVVKLVDARDSKSRGASTPCRFDSDLRHHPFLFSSVQFPIMAVTDDQE
jgi:hypothetical protein